MIGQRDFVSLPPAIARADGFSIFDRDQIEFERAHNQSVANRFVAHGMAMEQAARKLYEERNEAKVRQRQTEKRDLRAMERGAGQGDAVARAKQWNEQLLLLCPQQSEQWRIERRDRKAPAAAESQTCSHCGQTPTAGTELKTCGRCRRVLYCDKYCQRDAWKKGHKLVCEPVVAAQRDRATSEQD